MADPTITVHEAELHAGARTLMTDDQLAALRLNLQAKVDGRVETLNDLLLLQLIDQVLSKRRADIAPGVMRCAKCEFQLIRQSLNVNVGTVTAGGSHSEPCPNGCGPLWPVTWREQALEASKAAEAMFERAKAAEDRLAQNWAVGELTPDVIEILGRPNFACRSFADMLRLGGQDIPFKSEREQAATLHYLLGFYAKDGAEWRQAVLRDVDERQAKAAEVAHG